MNRSTLRLLVALFALITALIHLSLGIRDFTATTLGKLFVLNSLSYLILLAAFWFDMPKGQSRLVHYALIAFAAVTIVAFFVVNGRFAFSSTLGLIAKADEVLLIIVTYLHLQRS